MFFIFITSLKIGCVRFCTHTTIMPLHLTQPMSSTQTRSTEHTHKRTCTRKHTLTHTLTNTQHRAATAAAPGEQSGGWVPCSKALHPWRLREGESTVHSLPVPTFFSRWSRRIELLPPICHFLEKHPYVV